VKIRILQASGDVGVLDPGSALGRPFERLGVGLVDLEGRVAGQACEPVRPRVIASAEDHDLVDRWCELLDDVVDQFGADDGRGSGTGAADEVVSSFDQLAHWTEMRRGQGETPRRRDEVARKRILEQALVSGSCRFESALDRHQGRRAARSMEMAPSRLPRPSRARVDIRCRVGVQDLLPTLCAKGVVGDAARGEP
jgi:hypothetical protein